MTSDNTIHICFSSNHRYINGLLVTFVSIMRSAGDRGRLAFHIFSDGLTEEDLARIRAFAAEYGVREPEILTPDLTGIAEEFPAYKNSHSAFLRLFYPEILDLEWVVYTDVDTLWNRDVCELWNLRRDEASVMACADLPSLQECTAVYQRKWDPDFRPERYFCSGVMLMNLKRLRETGFTDRCRRFAEQGRKIYFADQDILNHLCNRDVILLPGVWDLLNPAREALDGFVYHFCGVGSMFNSGFSGWRPLYVPWFRFYYDYILKEPRRPVCSLFKRAIFFLLGTFYPNRRLIAFFLRKRHHLIDNVCRQIFFAWLQRHYRNSWKYGHPCP